MEPLEPLKQTEKNQEGYVQLHSPSIEDFERSSGKELHALWRENHVNLKKAYQASRPHFFGFHGTNQEAFRDILETQKGLVEIATFYEKEYGSEQFFYKLYDAALYVSSYANKKLPPGRILVFDLEKNNKNITRPWEHLFPRGELRTTFTFDSEEEHRNFSLMEEPEDLLWRSDVNFSLHQFNDVFLGSIDLNSKELSKYSAELTDPSHLIMRNRFLAQEIAARPLHLFANKNNKE